MNYMKQVAQMLGVELEEEFYLLGFSYKHKITKNGTFFYHNENQKWYRTRSDLSDILTGEFKIIKNPILDDVEKEYLSNIIKPFRNQVFNICKHNIICCEYEYEQIKIQVKDGIDNGYTTISLPIFKKDTMYKGMKAGKAYSLEDLGL